MTPNDRLELVRRAARDADPLGIAAPLLEDIALDAAWAAATGHWAHQIAEWRQAEHGLSRQLGTDAHAGVIDPAREARRAVYRAAVRVAERWL